VAAGESARHGNDTGHPFKDGFHAPEAAAAEIGDFGFVRCDCIHGIGWLSERSKIQCADSQQKKQGAFHFGFDIFSLAVSNRRTLPHFQSICRRFV
jgi:hypothetical protein